MTAPNPWTTDPELLALTRLVGMGLRGAAPWGHQGAAPCAVGQPNWIRLTTLALAHGTGGLVHRAIAQGQPVDMPGPLAQMLAQHAAAIARRNGALLAELLRLRRVLDQAGVESIPLKGVWLNQRLYADPAARVSRDIDFLVRPHAGTAALHALASAGYAMQPMLPPRQFAAKARYAGQLLLHRHDAAFAIEPHWALAPQTLGLNLDHAGLWHRTRITSADNGMGGTQTLPILAPEDEFIMLCVHGFKEEWSRIKLIADLAQFIRVHPALDWNSVAQRVAAQNLRWIAGVAVLLVAAMFHVETGCTETARRTPALAVLTGELLSRLTAAAATRMQVPLEPSIYAVSRTRLRMRERPQDRARYIWRTIITPREAHFRAIPLPDRLFRAYVGVKLLHDYALLPCWLLSKRLRRLIAARNRA